MSNLFGYNIHGEMADKADNVGGSVNDLIKHLDQSKPRHTLVLRNFGLALTLAKRYPVMTVHVRYWSNEAVINDKGQYTIQPKTWLDNVKKDWQIAVNQGIRNLSFYTTNEPRQLKDIANWHKDLINVNNRPEYRLPLTLINFGYYEPYEIPLFKEVLQLIAENKELYILGIHEYFTALPSSGMPELDSNGKPYFPIAYDKWDRRENATRYHVGRHQFILKFCDDNNIPRPRIVITEFGADRLDEGGNWVGQWLNSLRMTPPYTNIRGWKSVVNQWFEWFKDWTANQTYFYMMQYLAVRVFESNYLGKPRNIEGILIFSWWNSGKLGSAEDWTQFRVDKETLLLNYIANYNNGVRLGLEAITIVGFPDKNDKRWYKTQAKTLTPTKIYSDKNTSSSVVGELNIGLYDVLAIYDPLYFGAFIPIIWNGVSGWVQSSWVSLTSLPVMPLKSSDLWQNYTIKAKSSAVHAYDWMNTQSRKLLRDLSTVNALTVKHIPTDKLTPQQQAYLTEDNGVKWLVVYSDSFLDQKVGYVIADKVILEPVKFFENPSPDDLRWQEYKIRAINDISNIYNLPNGSKLSSINRNYINIQLITFDKMSDNERELSEGKWALINIPPVIGWINIADFEVYLEPEKPDYSDIYALIDSALSELQNVKNNLVTIRSNLENR